MNRKKIYVLVLALGLTMVWLGFLFYYVTGVGDQQQASYNIEATDTELGNSLVPAADDRIQEAGVSPEATDKSSTSFPLFLAGLGVVFVLGGVFSVHHEQKYC